MTHLAIASKYRPDIDGLRAVAVIPVCCFHAGLPIFSGGFVGVDVFFVISGYFMALMIGGALGHGDFSFVGFYERRIRRILPALFVMLLFVTCVACVMVPPKLLRDFGLTLVATVFFASNLAFSYKSANYFDAPTESNPLLHTWSLSVEEQFYLLFPVCVALFWRFGKRSVLGVIVLGASASLALSIWGTANAPTATFYLLPMRVWELLVGAIVALRPTYANATKVSWLRTPFFNSVAGLVGLLLILVSLLAFDSEMAFPGVAALIPCLGAAMVIYFGRSGSPTTRLLSIAPLNFVGRISYSLYLWHWPLIVFGEKYHAFGPLGLAQKSAVIVASGVIGYFSWRWVEQPFRGRDAVLTRNGLFGAAAGLAAVFGLAGYLAQSSNGWPSRFKGIETVALAPQLAAERSDLEWQALKKGKCFVEQASDWGGDSCFLSKTSQSKALLWGDSFASNYAYGFFASKTSQFDALLYSSPQCPPIVGYAAASRPQCEAVNKEIPGIIGRFNISTVIMAANWDSYIRRRKIRLEDIAATIRYLHGLGVLVVLVGQSPIFSFVYPDEYFYTAYGSEHTARAYEAPIYADPDINAKMSVLSHADFVLRPDGFALQRRDLRVQGWRVIPLHRLRTFQSYR
jgi:peptidoglycan/LPS O-acetylase OafA/YrhL